MALQARRVAGGLRQVLDDIRLERGTLPQTTLRSIWNTLNDNQRLILRTIAELEVPEPEDQLGEIIKDMHWNRLARSLRTLKSLNLVVVKRQADGPDLIELHPMVREFIRMESPKKERERYIATILNFLDRMIGRYKSLLPQTPSLQILENWTHKVELELNRGNYDAALCTLREVSGPLVDRGFPQEFLRIARKTLRLIDWSHACVSSKDFDPVLATFVKVLVEFGAERDADDMLEKYEASMPGKSAQYIHLCDLRTYALWYRGEFEKAVFWGERGETLLKESNVDTKWSTGHNLALARRDIGRVDEALSYFLSGTPLVDVIEGTVEKQEAQYYGNIGRCLFMSGRLHDAEICYRKSAALLTKGLDAHALLNRGYIRDWMAQLWEQQGRLVEAYAAWRAAEAVWQQNSPPRSAKSASAANRVLAVLPNAIHLRLVEAWRFESMFSAWVSTGIADSSILDD
jgi:tetratricopeptide (TPR) repeat protein